MNPTPILNRNLVMLARVLERLDRSTERFDADQYRALVNHLACELETTPRAEALEAVLEAFPAVAELYENLNYQQAGLCRSCPHASQAAAVVARAAIEAAKLH